MLPCNAVKKVREGFLENSMKSEEPHKRQSGGEEKEAHSGRGNPGKKTLLWEQTKQYQGNKIINKDNRVSSARRDIPRRNTGLANR